MCGSSDAFERKGAVSTKYMCSGLSKRTASYPPCRPELSAGSTRREGGRCMYTTLDGRPQSCRRPLLCSQSQRHQNYLPLPLWVAMGYVRHTSIQYMYIQRDNERSYSVRGITKDCNSLLSIHFRFKSPLCPFLSNSSSTKVACTVQLSANKSSCNRSYSSNQRCGHETPEED